MKETIGQRIKVARIHAKETRKMTQPDLAKAVGVTCDTIRNWEHNRVVPDNKRLQQIAQICHVDWRWLLHGDVVNGFEDDSLKDAVVHSFDILAKFNPEENERRFKEALFNAICSAWGMGLQYDLISDKDDFYKFMKASIISNTNIYLSTINPHLTRK